MITRKDYIAGKASHQEYYGQFVSPANKMWVEFNIGLKRLRESEDPAFNDIPLRNWDHYQGACQHDGTGAMLAKANGTNGFSLSDAVCVAKAAARELLKNGGWHE